MESVSQQHEATPDADVWAAPALALMLLATPWVVLWAPAFTVVRANPDYFPVGLTSARYLFAAGGGLLVLGLAAAAYRRLHVGRLALIAYAALAPAWYGYSIALNGIGRSSWVAVPGAIVWLLASGVLAGRPQRSARDLLTVCAAFVVVGTTWTLISAAPEVVSRGDVEGDLRVLDDVRPVNHEDVPNVYHIILDEYQGQLFEFTRDDHLEENLRGFTNFSDTTTTYGRTDMALASMYSFTPYLFDQPPVDFMERAFHDVEASSLAALRAHGYHLTGWLHRISQFGFTTSFDATLLHDQVAATSMVSGQEDLAFTLWAYRSLPGPLVTRLVPAHQLQQLEGGGFLPDDAPARSLISFRSLMAAESTLSDHGRYTVSHLILPHHPNVLDSNCEYEPGITVGPLEQARCANRLIIEFIEMLQAADRFDESTIVIHSDHGSGYDITDDGIKNLQSLGLFSEEWSTSRADAMLLIKPSGMTADEPLQDNDVAAKVEDIMPTVYASLGLQGPFGDDRSDVFSSNFPARPERPYFFYDKGPEDVVGQMQRYIIRDRGATTADVIEVPSEATTQ